MPSLSIRVSWPALESSELKALKPLMTLTPRDFEVLEEAEGVEDLVAVVAVPGAMGLMRLKTSEYFSSGWSSGE